jgi:hypothetical protein
MTTPKSTAGAGFLPPSGPLLPPSDGGRLLDIGTEGGGEFVAQLDRAGAEALVIGRQAAGRAQEAATRLAALAAEKAPEVGQKLTGLALAAKTTLGDRNKRGAWFANHRRTMMIGAGAVVLVAGGGWFYAAHQATETAKAQVDAFIRRYKLSHIVSYGGISASPFGTVTLSDVVVKPPHVPGILKAGSLMLSGLVADGKSVSAGTVAAESLELPFLEMARRDGINPFNVTALGLGYTKLKGDLKIGFKFDDAHQTLTVSASGSARDAGGFDATLKFGNLTSLTIAGAVAALVTMVPGTGEPDLGQALVGAVGAEVAMRTVMAATLAQLDVSVDNSGVMKRMAEMTDAALPDEAAPANAQDSAAEFFARDLMQAGMDKADAESAAKAIGKWSRKGGTLRISTRIDEPLPLVKQRGFYRTQDFAFGSPAEFLAATRATVSN